MKIEELRINNWVNLFLGIDDNGTQYRPMQIKGIMEDLSGEFYYLNTNSANWVYSTQNLEPIPLTEDILLKCGFEIINENSAEKRYGIVENHVFDGDASLIYWNTTENAGKIFRGDMEIKSLHQLQSLIHALTGKELEINL